MVYGDLQIVDILIFAGIAAFLVFRLRNVLGKRTGFSKKTKENFNLVPNEKNDIKIKPAPELQENISKLKTAYEAMDDFDHNNFIEGAKNAFETIINAFNKGDKKTLKNLLTPDVFTSFEEAIDSKKIDSDYQFYSLNIKNIESVTLDGGQIKICIKFISEQFKNNDESTVVKKQDTWTFEKEIKSNKPNWLLSST